MTKKTILSIVVLFLISLAVASTGAEAQIAGEVDMTHYCAVPPYVIENVTPNIMLLVDNSGSMYNFSYACTNTTITAAGSNTNVIPVTSVSGFSIGQAVELKHSGTAVSTPLWITAIDATGNNLTVGANIAAFSANDTIKDEGCSDANSYFYDQASSICPSAATSACNNPGTYPTTTVSVANTSGTRTKVTVNSITNFYVGENILVGSTAETIQSISSNVITVNNNVTTSVGQVVKDADYDTCNSYKSGANILFNAALDADFYVGRTVVIVRSGTPITSLTAPTTVTAISTTNRTLQFSSSVNIVKGDVVYDYECYKYQTPYPEMSFDPNKLYFGYYNNSAFYTYTTSRFTQSRVKSGNTKASTEWDGNFLNWLTMRRADIIKAVLTGGYDVGSDGSGYRKIRALKPDGPSRGIYKAVANAEQYINCSGWSCTANMTANFSFTSGSTPPETFTAYSGSGSFTSAGTFNVDVQVPSPVAGALQNTIGAKARIGLTYYAGDNGGKVAVPISGGALNSVVSSINIALSGTSGAVSATNTPLGEALYSIVGYFQQNNAYSGHYTTPSTSSTGPLYNSGDWTVSAAVDPFNYGTSTTPRYPPCVQNFVLVITDGEPTQDGNIPATDSVSGKKVGNVSSSDTPFVCSGSTCPAVSGTSPDTYSFPSVPIYGGGSGSVAGLEKVAYFMHTTNLRPAVYGTTVLKNLTGYFIFAFGQGSGLLKYASINGAFDTTTSSGLNPSKQATWDTNSDGQPDNYYEASDGYALQAALDGALSTMLKRASSGTAASVLASGQSSGANIVQAIFYPRRNFGNTIINWTGEAQNMWYYKDPKLTSSTIREDTVADQTLNLISDFIAQPYFDTAALQTKAYRWQDVNGDGSSLVSQPTVTLENLSAIWKAGQMLWKRNLTTLPRTIYTTTDSKTLISFSEANGSTLAPYLQLTAGTKQVSDIIRFVHGYRDTSDGYTFDYSPRTTGGVTEPIIDRNSDGSPDYRLRTVKIGSGASSTNIWKLGDMVNATPQISSWLQLNTYDTRYGDSSYSNFVNSSTYTQRGIVFAGSNDGMLHAFKLGKLVLTDSNAYQKASLVNTADGYNLGDEKWAFIPKQVLPYLIYTADPDYCHLYTVDLTPMIFDASIGAPGSGDVSAVSKTGGSTPHDCSGSDPCDWRTILIGGMRWGGACRKTGTACNSKACNVTTSTSCTIDTDCPSGETCDPNCVNTPITDPGNSSKGLGYSSYFALDITDQNNPSLLWEFSEANSDFPSGKGLGFSSTGPAIVRVGSKQLNGKWFVIFGSGPTGPMDVNNYQFLGRSDQALQYHVLDLKTGAYKATITPGISNAFSGSLARAAVDTDQDYQDDAVYVGYVSKCASTSSLCTAGTWTDGGIGAIITHHNADPTQWTWRSIMSNLGPVTSAIDNLWDPANKILWLYAGTGRYFYEQSTTVDDADNQRYIFGLKDPCCDISSPSCLDNTCSTTRSLSDLTDVTNVSNVPTVTGANGASFKGWKISLDGSGSYTYSPDPAANFRAERVVTDTTTMTSGNVLFVTYKPYADECGVGGKSFLWGVRYNTGGAPGAAMIGNALLQTSTGAITQVDFYKQLTAAGGRKTGTSVEGYSSQDAPSTVTPLAPIKKQMHLIER